MPRSIRLLTGPARSGLLVALALGGSPFASVDRHALAGQQTLTEHTLTGDGTPPPAASISDVAWLTGRWSGEGLGATAEESWLPPTGDSMVGVFRLAGDDGVAFYEIVVIREAHGSLVLRLKHFEPDLTGWEEREETVDFPLVARSDDTLWFDGLTIERSGPDQMDIWVALGSEGGDEMQEARFRYRRAGGLPEG